MLFSREPSTGWLWHGNIEGPKRSKRVYFIIHILAFILKLNNRHMKRAVTSDAQCTMVSQKESAMVVVRKLSSLLTGAILTYFNLEPH